MKLFRKIFFWAHLAAGLIAGISIAIMCFTGAALAFESEIVAWTERDVRRVEVPANPTRLSLDEMLAKVRETKPDARPSGITILPDAKAAVAFNFGRDGAAYVNPYTGEVREPAAVNKAHDFMHVMEDWHRVLAMGGENRATGKVINGVCNIAFCFLAISGLYLWMPRSWSWRGVKAIAFFNFKFSGKARDFNWHNVIGLWSAPILIVLTLTAIPISFRWGGNLIIRLSGEEVPVAPAQGAPGGFAAAPAVEVPKPAPGTRPASYDVLLASVQKEIPEWSSISFRLGAPTGRGGAGGGQRPASATAQANTTPAPTTPTTASAETPRQRSESEPRRTGGEGAPRREGGQRAEGAARGEGRSGEGRGAAVSAVSVSIREPNSFPRTASTTLTLNPYNGEVLKREGYRDLPTSRQVRSWTRFLHTGQALGWIGQLVAGLACLGGCFLVYTGFALSWRRFFFKKKSMPAAAAAE